MSTIPATDEPFISVVIPTYNGQWSIGYALSNLLSQQYPRDRFEVLVVDDGSSDRTVEIVNLFKDEFVPEGFNIQSLRNEGEGACSARNTAILVSKGEIIAMTDQDVFIPQEWLRQIATIISSKGVSGLYGDITTDFSNFIEPLNGTAINSRYLTANVAYRRDILLEVGMFSNEFPFFRGDSDLAYKIMALGHRIEHAPNILVYHPLKKFQWGSLRGFLKWSTYDPLLFKKHPEFASKDTLRQVVPRFTPEGLAFALFTILVLTTAVAASPAMAILLAFAMSVGAVAALSMVRSSLKDKPWSLRVKAAFFSLVVYLPIVLGRLAGSVRYRKFIL